MRFRRAIHVILGLGGALAAGQGVRAIVMLFPQQAGFFLYGVIPITLCAGLIYTWFRLEQSWKRPALKLTQLLTKVRGGELPIDELSSIEGGVKPLAKLAHDLLRNLREERRKTAQLEHEMRDRIAHRTEALERMIGSLRQQATRNALTGLFNRRMLDQHLPELMTTCRESGNELCVLTIDVDNFKLLNDTLGHAEGDNLLRSIGQLIRSTVRQNDAAFRCGGDEFLIALPGTEPPAAKILADRLISLVDALTQTLKLNPRPRLSIGHARLFGLAEPTPEALLSEADRSLYEEKSRRKRHQREAALPKTPVPAFASK